VMKYVRIIVMLYILFLLPSNINGQDAKAPKIFIEERTWNFGTIKQHSKVTHIFKVQNRGNADLIITRLRTTCGCTAALMSEKQITPGHSGEIKVTFSSGRRIGKQTQYVYVQSNDPNEPILKLTVKGEVETGPSPKIEVYPDEIDLGMVLPAGKYQETINIKNIGRLDLVVNEIKGQGLRGYISTNLNSKKVIPPGRMNKIKLYYEA
ncbi:MAG TPA: DUF1573 domain-containing protein, partial [bacterium (Candidatus Stahlbacteria)]|nr:DUF1573 domain-containing protein [Candidatus Stahlbacteria bacterium]